MLKDAAPLAAQDSLALGKGAMAGGTRALEFSHGGTGVLRSIGWKRWRNQRRPGRWLLASAGRRLKDVPVRILGVNGSVQRGSGADRALHFTLGVLEHQGAHCETFEIGSLPIRNGKAADDNPATVVAWRAAVEAADGLVLAVSTMHGALTGGLKNALDFLDGAQVEGKPFALVGISRGDAEPGVSDAARVLRHMGAVAAVPDVVISRAGEHWGDGDEPANRQVAIAIERVAEGLVRLCGLRAEGKLPTP